MPQIANQDYNVIDFNELPYYEAVERLYRAYINGTAFDCVVRLGNKKVEKIFAYEEVEDKDKVFLIFNNSIKYYLEAPLATSTDGYLVFKLDLYDIYIVSANGFKLKPIVTDGVLTGVEVTTEKIVESESAQYFKDWMIGQPVGA